MPTKIKKAREATEHPHPGKPLAGRSTGTGAAFEASAVQVRPQGADLAYDRPRPSPTRYPIAHDTFVRLKHAALTSKGGTAAKRASTIVHDKPAKAPPAAPEVAFAGTPLSAAPTTSPPTLLNGFPGISATGWLPPDCTLAVGPNHVLVSVNASIAVYPKGGGAAGFTRTLSSWFSNVISSAKIFDPKALYDQHTGRWVLLTVALGPSAKESYFLLSVSKTADPTAGWWNYKLDATKDGGTKTNNWADYPSLGLDSQALYLTANMFAFGGNFAYAKVRVVPKAGPYSGGAAVFKDLVRIKHADGSLAFTVQPCHTFGAPNVEYLIGSRFPTTSAPETALSLWSLSNPIASPTLSVKSIAVSPYTLPPDAVQRGGGTPLDSGDVRMLNAVYRGGSVWCAMTTAQNYGSSNVAAIHWFQMNPTSGGLTQQGIYGAKDAHYFYPALMPDSNGNLIMVFSRSSSTEYASARFTGRLAADPLGTLKGSALLKAGIANYTGLDGSGRNRWGDYAGVGSDPADSLRVWLYSMYTATSSNWATAIGSAKF